MKSKVAIFAMIALCTTQSIFANPDEQKNIEKPEKVDLPNQRKISSDEQKKNLVGLQVVKKQSYQPCYDTPYYDTPCGNPKRSYSRCPSPFEDAQSNHFHCIPPCSYFP